MPYRAYQRSLLCGNGKSFKVKPFLRNAKPIKFFKIFCLYLLFSRKLQIGDKNLLCHIGPTRGHYYVAKGNLSKSSRFRENAKPRKFFKIFCLYLLFSRKLQIGDKNLLCHMGPTSGHYYVAKGNLSKSSRF